MLILPNPQVEMDKKAVLVSLIGSVNIGNTYTVIIRIQSMIQLNIRNSISEVYHESNTTLS